MFTKEEIEYCIKNKKILAKKNMFPNTPSWDAFIANTHYEFHNNAHTPPGPDDPYNPDETIINGVNKRENFYLMVASELNSRFFPEQQEPIKVLNEIMGTEANNVGTFLNFVGNEPPSNIHFDPRHSFYWQCIGTSTWKTFDDIEDENNLVVAQEVVLEQGDVAFIPYGAFHTVDTPEPRAAISICYPHE